MLQLGRQAVLAAAPAAFGAGAFGVLAPVGVLDAATQGKQPLWPSLGLGTCCDEFEAALPAISAGLDAGYRLIDTAAHYASEPAVGSALALQMASGSLKRSDVTLCTKIWFDDMGYDRTTASIQRSLRNLRTDHLDILLVHFPGSPDAVQDPTRNRKLRAETWRACEDAQAAGLARSIGVSNWTRRHLRETLKSCRVRPALLQTEVHPRLQQRELVEMCGDEGIQVMAYCPLAHGSANLLTDPTMMRIARGCGRSTAQVALRWSVQRGMIPVPKASSPARLRDNLQALEFELSDDAMLAIDGLEAGDRVAFDPSLIA